MDLMESTTDDKNVETTTTTTASNDDVLVVLQTETGEQIALPMSALPSDFVPGDSGQIIMVEGGLDEQQQEVVVESSDITETHTNLENLVSISTDTNGQHVSETIHTDDLTSVSNDLLTHHIELAEATTMQTNNSGDRPVPRTYSKNNTIKSYTPTCGQARIYQPSSQTSQALEQTTSLDNSETMTPSGILMDLQAAKPTEMAEPIDNADTTIPTSTATITITTTDTTTTTSVTASSPDDIAAAPDSTGTDVNIKTDDCTTTTTEPVVAPIIENPKPPHKKQKRKERLLTRPLNEEDMVLEFQVIEEPSPVVREVEVKRRPRKEYRTKKKVRMAMERTMSKEEYVNVAREMALRNRGTKRRRQDLLKKDDSKEETDKDEETNDEEATDTKIEDAKKDEKVKEEDDKDETKKDEAKKDEVKVKDEPTNKRDNTRGQKRDMPKRDLPKRGTKEKTIETPQPQPKPQPQPQVQSERRTRLSNACRVATGKSYKCNECDFSTDRINNIILHVKESCPKLKKT